MSGCAPRAPATFAAGPTHTNAGRPGCRDPGTCPEASLLWCLTRPLLSAEFPYQGSPRGCGEPEGPCDIAGVPLSPGQRARWPLGSALQDHLCRLLRAPLASSPVESDGIAWFPPPRLQVGGEKAKHGDSRRGFQSLPTAGETEDEPLPGPWPYRPSTACPFQSLAAFEVPRAQAGSEGRSRPPHAGLCPASPLLPLRPPPRGSQPSPSCLCPSVLERCWGW